MFNQSLRILAADLVLSCARQCDIALHAPWLLTLKILSCRYLFQIFPDSAAMTLLDLQNDIQLNSIRIIDISIRIRHRDNFCSKLLCLPACILRDIAGTRDDNRLSSQFLSGTSCHFLGDIHQAIASSFRSCQRTSEGKTLARQNPLILAGDPLVLTIQIADFASAYANIACRNILVRADILIQLGHETLAETHDFGI